MGARSVEPFSGMSSILSIRLGPGIPYRFASGLPIGRDPVRGACRGMERMFTADARPWVAGIGWRPVRPAARCNSTVIGEKSSILLGLYMRQGDCGGYARARRLCWPGALGLALLAGLAFAPRAEAGCNVIPPAVESFRGAQGSTDRPFARPGDLVRLTLDPACLGTAGFPGAAADYVVSVVYTPPAGGPRHVVALATNCAAVDTASCAARADVADAFCVTVNGGGGPVGLDRPDARTLRFRFPDSDAFLRDGNDDLTLTGPVTLAVSAAGAPLPCALASLPCNRAVGLRACVDALYAENGTCNAQPQATFTHFTALPPPNDYQALCTDPSPPCTGLTDELRFTVDARGNLLIPMDWRGVRVDRDAVPVARLLRASSSIEAFEGRGAPIRIADLASLGSFSENGIKLPPLFDPQSDPTATASATFFGSTGAEETVLRIARHRTPTAQCAAGANAGLPCASAADCAGQSCAAPVCSGGANAGAACSVDPECPGAECGAGLFDFSTRLLDGAGPVRLRLDACLGGGNAGGACSVDGDCPGGQCGAFTLAALDPVPLDGLNQSSALNAFVLQEAIAEPATDLNGDGDTLDAVVEFADRATGNFESIGGGGSPGRAVARIQQPPFSFPALAAEGDLLAFLEPEQWQGNADANANGRVFDTTLKAYRLGAGEISDPMAPLAAEATPLVGGRSLAASNGLLFVRSAESAGATQVSTRVSVDSAGAQATGGAFGSVFPSLSGDGRWVAFSSHATNLVPDDTNNVSDTFVHDRLTGTTTRVSVGHTGAQANNPSIWAAHLSHSGRYVALASDAFNLVPGDTNGSQDIFVHDRDADGDGIFDETGPGERSNARVSVASDGSQSNGRSFNDVGSISPDGRFVTFASDASNLVPDDGNGVTDVFLHDRDADADGIFDEAGPGERATVRISDDAAGGDANGRSQNVSASGDGRFVVFESSACDLVPGDCSGAGDSNGFDDIFLRDRDADADGIFDEPGASSTVRLSVGLGGEQGNHESFEPHISADGSTVVFVSRASNLVAGDTNGFRDVYAWDRASGTLRAVTVSQAGRFGNSNSGSPMPNADGRFIVFDSRANNLTAGVTGGEPQVLLHDRLTGQTALLSVTPSGDLPNGGTGAPFGVSADGAVVAFKAAASDVVAGDTNGQEDVFVRAAALGSNDLSGDGRPDDILLRVLDTGTGPPSAVINVCPAADVAVADGRAAFLRPESAGPAPALADCPTAPLVGGAPDLNGDGDAVDTVVHLWDGGAAQNLGRAARAVALSDAWVAALVDEAANGAADLNGDGDARDAVVQMHPVDTGGWLNVSRAAEALAVSGSRAAFLVPESAQGGADLNGDGDAGDRVAHTYDAATATLTNIARAGEELVLGDSGLIAFRTLELRQNDSDLNGDGDAADGVLHIYDAAAGVLHNTRQAVTPCRLEACDPRVPYRVRDDTVTFLTLEADQGADLNGDGDEGDLVLQVFNARQDCGGGPEAACHTLAAASAGICTDSGAACAGDDACPSGSCFVPPGGCRRDLGTPCDPLNGAGCNLATQFCQPLLGLPGQGTCAAIENACRSDADCTAPATCSQSAQDFQRLMDPLSQQGGGAAVFTGAGRCTENLAVMCVLSAQCGAGAFCLDGLCRRQYGTCASQADCPPESLCQPDLVRATAADADLDELPDVIDNCPLVANVTQADLDADGVGDACDGETCGNGVAEGGEDCDDGDDISGDGCEADCSLAPVLLSGAKLIVKDTPAANERSLLLLSKDAAGLAPPAGAAQDPTVGGARVELVNDGTGERAFIALPAAGWVGLGNPAGASGYKYRDTEHTLGPCKIALFKPGRALKLSCRGSGIAFTLNEATQAALRVAVRIGAGSGGLKFCTRFGGTVVADRPADDQTGLFKAKAAAAPTSCPR